MLPAWCAMHPIVLAEPDLALFATPNTLSFRKRAADLKEELADLPASDVLHSRA